MPHTPGPWEMQSPEDDAIYIVGSDLGGLIGAALPWASERDSGDISRVEANAKLIAAAPDMLTALIDARGVLIGDPDFEAIAATIEAAIAKATT